MVTASEYLSRIKKIDHMIRNKLDEHDHWESVASGLGGGCLDERVQTSRNLHKGADAIDKYIDIEAEIRALQKERQEIISTIERLPTEEYDLTYRLYVKGESMKEIAYHFGKSYDWVKRKKSYALKLVQHMLDESQTSTERR